MIFLSAQPDNPYFIWQIELQLFHFALHGWPPKDVHVLISYAPNIGPSQKVNDLIDRFTEYTIALYDDTRVNKKYASTIRPHIIEKHFVKHPELRKDSIFYIDSDVLFKEMPNFSILLNDDLWYASNTISYMSYNLIVEALGYDVFRKMCQIVDISPELVIEKEQNTGGAQYIIKNVPKWFWPKVENDSNLLYDYLHGQLFVDTEHNFFEKGNFDIWLTEMWAVCWNAILADKAFVLHQILDFCWANQSIECWNRTYMLHYTGSVEDNTFRKTDYFLASPFYADLSHISKGSSTAPMKKIIKSYRHFLEKDRVILEDLTLLISVTADRKHKIDNLTYFIKCMKTNIIILDLSTDTQINTQTLPSNVEYRNISEYSSILEYLEDFLSSNINTSFVGFVPSNIIIPVQQIVKTVNKLREGSSCAMYPFSTPLRVDVLTKYIFSQILEDRFLLENVNKFHAINIDYFSKPFFIRTDIGKKMSFNKNIDTENGFEYITGYLFVN